MSDDEEVMTMMWEGEVEVVNATDKALLVEYEGEEFWIPKSMIDDDSEIFSSNQVGDTGILIIPYWLAEKKEMAG